MLPELLVPKIMDFITFEKYTLSVIRVWPGSFDSRSNRQPITLRFFQKSIYHDVIIAKKEFMT